MTSFQELNLIAPVQRAIADEKYERPTPIQEQTIPEVLNGRDILGCAQTGTGKTAAFALPILSRLGEHNQKSIPNSPRVLVLAPTRELAVQIGESFATYGRHLKLRQVLVYGGVSQFHQVAALNRGIHILVATPGRLLDLMNQGHVDLDSLEVFVLDEADRMLDMGFLPDIRRIIDQLPDQRQSLFFSATMPPKILQLSQHLQTNPLSVNVTPKVTSVEAIDQQVMFVERNQKHAVLKAVLRASDVGQALVFTRTKRGANFVAEQLSHSGLRATAIHGNKSQSARERALEQFRRGKVQVLVATDLAARGIDIDGISHVVNFEIPDEPESYVHRIGRTGRAGASGVALSLCSSSERGELRAIERLIGQKLTVNGEIPPVSPGDLESRNSGSGRRVSASNSHHGAPRSNGHRPRRKFSDAEARRENGRPKRRRPARRKGQRTRQPATSAR